MNDLLLGNHRYVLLGGHTLFPKKHLINKYPVILKQLQTIFRRLLYIHEQDTGKIVPNAIKCIYNKTQGGIVLHTPY